MNQPLTFPLLNSYCQSQNHVCQRIASKNCLVNPQKYSQALNYILCEKTYKGLSAHVRHQWSPYHSNQGAQSQVVPDLTNHNRHN